MRWRLADCQSTLQFSSVQPLSHVLLFETPWTAAHQISLSIASSQGLLKLMFIESVMPSNHLICCYPILLPSIVPSIRVSYTSVQKHQFFSAQHFFIMHLSHPYTTTEKTVAWTRWTIVGKIMSLLFNMLSKLVIAFLPRSKHLLNSWLQSPSAMI